MDPRFSTLSTYFPLYREIGRKDPGDLSLDAGGTRQFASFLAEVAQRVPEAVYPSVSCLLPHLGYEVSTTPPTCT